MGTNHGNIEDIYPLSPMQQGMLFHTLYGSGGSPLFQWTCQFDERLDIAAFRRAWQRVIERHSVLRTAIVLEEVEEPVQIVLQSVPLPWAESDFRGLSLEDRANALRSYLERDRSEPFELSNAPLMRLRLLRLEDQRYFFLWTFHLLLLDGWSTALVENELLAVYEAFCRGEEPRLESRRPYRDYIAWYQRPDRVLAEPFWRKTLKGILAPTPLVIDRTPTTAEGPGGDYADEEIRLSREAARTLHSFCRQHRLTLSTVLRASWALLLSRYSGEKRVVFGATMSGRSPDLPGVESMIGLFINTLPVRVDVPEDESVLPWLQRLQEEQAELLQYEFSRLVKVQGWSEVPRGLHLFESILVVQTYPVDKALQLRRERLGITEERGFERTNNPLMVIVRPGDQPSLSISFECARFEAASIRRMLVHFQTLLERIVEDPARLVSSLSCLPESERKEVLEEWNATEAEYPRDKTVHELFEAQVALTPEAVAVVFGSERVSYRELNDRANRLARYLRNRGVGPEILVGVYLERSLEMVIGLLAILKAGGAYVPLDPAYPVARVAFMLEDAAAHLVLTQQALSETLPAGGLERVRLDADLPAIARESAENLPNQASGKNLAYVIYTSGSTGTPKGVAIEHHSTVAFLSWARKLFSDAELAGVLASTSICFDLSVFELFAPLVWGGKVILVQDALGLPQLPAAGEVKLINTVPSAMSALLQMGELPESVATVNLAGEPLAGSLVQEIMRGGRVQRVFDLYGPTEDTTYSTCASRSADGPVTIGRPISNKRAYILDGDLRPVPVGVPGDLYTAGVGVARGYLNRPEQTAERFLPDPFRPGGRMYKTGDRARFLPGGDIQFLGRLDHQIKIRGYRIEIGEIEEALARHLEIAKCAVTARQEESGDKRLVAYLVARDKTRPSAMELRGLLKRTLPDYMIPSAFVFLDDLPLTPNGKVDRQALPAPGKTRSGLESAFAAPRTPIEEVLAGIWKQVLNLDQVGIHDNFFELGGQSILATQVFSRVRDHLRVVLPLRHLFETPTIQALAGLVEAARWTGPERFPRLSIPSRVTGSFRCPLRSRGSGSSINSGREALPTTPGAHCA